MKVTACLVTRGNVDMQPILDSLVFDHVIIWDNAKQEDHQTYGRYMAAEQSRTRLVWFQDDDMIVPAETQLAIADAYRRGEVLANMPNGYRSSDYQQLNWLGWGSLTEKSLPERAFAKWPAARRRPGFKLVGCDIVFSMLTPNRSVDLPVQILPYAFGDDRAYKQTEFQSWKRFFYRKALALA